VKDESGGVSLQREWSLRAGAAAGCEKARQQQPLTGRLAAQPRSDLAKRLGWAGKRKPAGRGRFLLMRLVPYDAFEDGDAGRAGSEVSSLEELTTENSTIVRRRLHGRVRHPPYAAAISCPGVVPIVLRASSR
jgi:hypothetical protein